MQVKFIGRKAGAIGIVYEIIAEVSVDPRDDYESCWEELDRLGFEHISKIELYLGE
jgi:hypothetical protein